MVQVTERPLAAVEPPLRPVAARQSRRVGALPFLLLAGVGLLLRMHELGERAYHHDESLHAVYSWYLYVGRGYIHDPLMHGPWQFHISALMYFLFGDSDVTGRLAAVLFGTVIVGLPYLLRHELGVRGAVIASLIFMLSPAFLYFSRFAREDIFFACFTLTMVVGIFGWIRTRDVRYLHFGSLALILAVADKEATYIHGFVFVTFFVALWATSSVHPLWPPVWRALRDISRRTWVECAAIFVVVYVLLFTTFLTNLGTPWNCLLGRPCQPGGLWSGSIGALAYWIDQHGVQRGGQPIYYYVLLLPLYEFVPLIFAAAAVGSRWFRRSLFGWFCAWWFVGNFVIYSWAGEKMPWLLPHLTMPLVLLASRWLGDWVGSLPPRALLARPALTAVGLGLLVVTSLIAWTAAGAFQTLSQLDVQALAVERLALLAVAIAAATGLVYLALGRGVAIGRSLIAVALLVLSFFYVHTSWMVTYKHGDIPVEMLVYVQSSPDVPWVTREIQRIGFQTAQRQDLRILMDNGYTENVGGQTIAHESVSWPFEWYLRDYKNRRYFTKTFTPDINLAEYPVILVMAPNLDPIRDQLGDYVGQKYRLNWWYPEEYKSWQTQPGLIWAGLSDPSTRARVLKYLVYREPLNPLGAREFYFFVRKDIPALGPAPSGEALPRSAGPAANLPFDSQSVNAARQTQPQPLDDMTTLWGLGPSGEPALVDPKGVAAGPEGRLYVTEGRSNRITVFDDQGTIVSTWGRGGNGPGEFAEPWGIAVSPSGEVYIADTWNHRIQKFSRDGQHLRTWGGLVDSRGNPRSAVGQFWGPRDVAVGPDGLIYVSDTGNKRVQVFDPEGEFVRAFGGAGTEPGQFNEPVGLTFDRGTLLVADAWNGRIQRLSLGGEPLGSVAVRGWESRNILNKPYLTTDGNGTIYATAPEGGEVLQIGPDGQVRGVARPSGAGVRLGLPTGLDLGQGGDLFVAESSAGVLSRQALRPER